MPSLTIVNPDFENPSLSDGGDTWGAIQGWILDGSSTGGIYNPNPGEISNVSGNNSAYLGPDAGDSASQTLADTYSHDQVYEISRGRKRYAYLVVDGDSGSIEIRKALKEDALLFL